jgi:hypothetical protein
VTRSLALVVPGRGVTVCHQLHQAFVSGCSMGPCGGCSCCCCVGLLVLVLQVYEVLLLLL